MLKWNSTSFLENKIFDTRLVKSSLFDPRQVKVYKERADYRAFEETYVILFFYLKNFKKIESKKLFFVDFQLFEIFNFYFHV